MKLWSKSNFIQHPPTLQNIKEALAYSISHHCHFFQALQCLHSRAITIGIHSNLYISSLLISKYFHFAAPDTARKLFDKIPVPPTKPLLWNSLISGYLNYGSPRLAIGVYKEMTEHSSVCVPDTQTFRLLIPAITRISDFELGYRVGSYVRRSGLELDILTGTSLVTMYTKAGDIEAARDVFNEMPKRDVVVYNAMISGYFGARYFSDAMALLKDVRRLEGISLTETSFVIVISGLADSDLVDDGRAVHGFVIKSGFEEKQNVLNALLAMYAGCDHLNVAADLFKFMALKDAVSWSTMIGGYVEHDKPLDALKLFKFMVSSTAIVPTRPILLNTLLACADLGDWQAGKWIEESFMKNESGILTADLHMITALIYMYAKTGKIEVALDFFENVELVRRDVVSWNAVLKATAEQKLEDQVLELFLRMLRNGINPDNVSFLVLLSVVASVPLPMKAMETHGQVIKRGFESERMVANSLIDAYGKCGYIDNSSKIFRFIHVKDVVSWSCMIKAYARNGNTNTVFHLFYLMWKKGLRPNSCTCLAVLSACSYAGLVKEGREFFESMGKEFGIEPGIEHFTCMIDIYCRAGLLKEAYHSLHSGVASSCVVLWGTLLSACRLHGDVMIGEEAAEHLFLLEPRNAANYLMLADIYISEGRREDANRVFSLLHAKGLEKEAGNSRFEGG